MKKIISLALIVFILSLCFCGCSEKTLLDPKKPVTLTLWHTYGEQTDSPMNRLVEEFNQTVGKEKGIVISVELMTVAAKIGNRLTEAKNGIPGAADIPDLFFCHNNDAIAFGPESLLNWKDYFTAEEINDFVPDFTADGIIGERLTVLPVSKSTHVLYLAGGEFSRFSAATGVTYDDLSTWDGFFRVAEQYYEYSDGKPFCAFDYIIRAIELNAVSRGADASAFYKNGWYDFDNTYLKESYLQFAEAIANGHIIVSDLYSNTQVMTGETPAGMGSSAGILYYNDTITYPDNTSEPTDLKVLPMPYANEARKMASQAGVGMCATKTTAQKAEAAAVFAHWLTDYRRNLTFATETGYMPVTNTAYKEIGTFSFEKQSYQNLYDTLAEIKNSYTLLREPSYDGYYARINNLYAEIRKIQSTLPERVKAGEKPADIANMLWELFVNIK